MSTVEYTIEYMYKIIALRSDFCALNVVIFESGQNTVSGDAVQTTNYSRIVFRSDCYRAPFTLFLLRSCVYT